MKNLENIKVTLLHDWLLGYRGGERVFEVLCELYPTSPIVTLFHKSGTTSKLIENHKIYTSPLNKIPFSDKKYRHLLPIMDWGARNTKLNSEILASDLYIYSSHCFIKAVPKPMNAKSLCYIHSPMRYMYDQYEHYFGSDAPILHQIGAKLFKKSIIQQDLESNKNIDHFVANSKFVAQRVEKFYQRKADVVYPFVDLEDIKKNISLIENKNQQQIDEERLQNKNWQNIQKQEPYFLMVTAFAPNKKVGLAIKVFNKLKHRLVIVGQGQQEKYLKSIAASHIEFKGSLSRTEVIEYMKNAEGFVFPGVEDFGITPLESLACGTPVIAFKEGGVLETLDSSVGLFFEEQTEESLKNAILKYDKKNYSKEKLAARANEFSKVKFKEEFSKQIVNILNQ